MRTSAESFTCPICGKSLSRAIVYGNRDEMIVSCENCGKYGITREYYEDYIEVAPADYKQQVEAFLKNHKSDELRPFISARSPYAPEGFKRFSWSAAAR